MDIKEKIEEIVDKVKNDSENIMMDAVKKGRSSQQVDEFLSECITPILEANKEILGENFEMKN
jgi:adenylosuccinate lyase